MAWPHLVTAVRYYQNLDHLDGLTRCLTQALQALGDLAPAATQ